MSSQEELDYTEEEKRLIEDAMNNLISIHLPSPSNIIHACQNVEALAPLLRQKSISDVLQLALVDSKALELVIHALTIHTTSWFREPLILDSAIQKLRAHIKDASEISVLSMACSTGHEVYSIAMLLAEQFPDHQFKITGIDIDPVSIDFAKDAVFKQSELSQIPLKYHQHILIGSGPTKNLFTLDDDLISRCSFAVKNICQPLEFNTKFDLILCRNVFIYLTTNDINYIKLTIHRSLKPHGLLCLGVSESLGSNTSQFTLYKPGIYQTTQSIGALSATSSESNNLKQVNPLGSNLICLNFSSASTVQLHKEYGSDIYIIDSGEPLPLNVSDIFSRSKTLISFGIPDLNCFLLKNLREGKFFHLLVVAKANEADRQLPFDQKSVNTGIELFSPSEWPKVKDRLGQILEANSRPKISKKEPFRLLVVEDDVDLAELFADSFSASGFAVKVCHDGLTAFKQLDVDRFDVLVTDFSMPGMNGGKLIRAALQKQPHLKCALVSGYLNEDSNVGLGPDIIRMSKPVLMDSLLNSILRKLGTLVPAYNPKIINDCRPALIVIGASTGGPQALQYILDKLTESKLPIVIVQHISEHFHDAFYQSLVNHSGLKLHFVREPVSLQPNTVYAAERNKHIEVREEFGKIIATSRAGDPEHGMCPAVDPLFSSVAASVKQTTIGILMTGMGRDGAAGLKLMKSAGHITVAQDEKTSAVYGMPKAATEIHAATMEATIDEIRQIIHVDSQSFHEFIKIRGVV
jgi:chemotaxis response regulator CheB/chemotaxis methyl-accepting protein methylase